MTKIVKLAVPGLVAVLIILQFFQPERNNAPPDPEFDMLSLVSPMEQVSELIRNACYDCHSNQTVYPWYSKISPVSWYLSKHIQKGKEDLNFSAYGQLDKADKIGVFTDIYDAMDAGTMPLRSYTLLHEDARLTEEERALLCNWTEEQALTVMRE